MPSVLVAGASGYAGALAARLVALLGDPAGLARAAASAARLGQPQAAQRLADLVLSLVRARAAQQEAR